MHPPVSVEQWAALRALREGEPPTFPRLAAAARLHVTTIRDKACRDSWAKQNFPRRSLAAADFLFEPEAGVFSGKDEGGAEGSREGEETAPGAMDGAGAADTDGLDMDGATPREQLARMASFVRRQIDAILASARSGRVDKTRVEGVLQLLRVMERGEAIVRKPDPEQQKRSDDELADIYDRIDARIEELAREYAEQMVAEQLDARRG